MCVFDGIVFFQIIDDAGLPSWIPSWPFDVVDDSPASDWHCQTLRGKLSLVLGPEFIAKSEDAYRAMVELDEQQVARFWKRVGALSPR